MYVFLATAIAAAIVGFGGAWQVQDWRHDALEKDRIEAAAEKAKFDRRAVDIAATAHEKDKQRIRTVTKVVIQEVERVIREPFYIVADAPACLDADGLRILSESIGAAPTSSKPARAVPGAKPAR